MSWKKFNIRLHLVLIFVLLLFSQKAISQIDSVWIACKTLYHENLVELNNLYCWEDSSFYPGKYTKNSIGTFQNEFEKLNLTIFPNLSENAEDFCQFLEGLDRTEKQNLIRYFSFFENDFEAALKSSGLPLELKYLAPAVSAMNPKSMDVDGKSGIWQLSHFKAVLNDLKINKLVDERFNETVSTSAFIRLINQNIENFPTPELAVLAYFSGNVKVKNAIYLSGEEVSIHSVLRQLPESAGYMIAKFQATAVFLNTNRFAPEFDLEAKNKHRETIEINRKIHFKQISDVLPVSVKQLEFLNPQFKFDIVPANEKQTRLVVPGGISNDFVLWQDSIYNRFDSTLFQFMAQKIEYPPAPNRQYLGEPVKDLEIEGKTKIKYRIKTGDVLGIIAENYDVRIADLMYWNNIQNERKIQAGKNLDIFVDDNKVDYYLSLANPKSNAQSSNSNSPDFQESSVFVPTEDLKSAKKIEHTVKSGESPYVIAKQYNGVTADQILEWNNINDARKIQIGQKLIVYIKNETR